MRAKSPRILHVGCTGLIFRVRGLGIRFGIQGLELDVRAHPIRGLGLRVLGIRVSVRGPGTQGNNSTQNPKPCKKGVVPHVLVLERYLNIGLQGYVAIDYIEPTSHY